MAAAAACHGVFVIFTLIPKMLVAIVCITIIIIVAPFGPGQIVIVGPLMSALR